MFLLCIILLVIVIYSIFFVSQLINIFVKGYAPFVSTGRATIKRITSEVQIKERATIYELGCGYAKFLRVMEKASPHTKLIGVEDLLSIYLIAKIRLKLQGSRIKLLKNDFFKVELKDADLVYCYLNNATMNKLGDIFKQECKKGIQIISRSFPIPQLEPEKMIKIKGKKVYFYKV